MMTSRGYRKTRNVEGLWLKWLALLSVAVWLIAAVPPEPPPNPSPVEPETPVARRLVRVCVYNFSPIIFEINGTAQGFFIDLLEYTASQEQWALQYAFDSFADCLARLEAGEVDLLPSIAQTPARQQKIDFTADYFSLDWGLLYRPPGSKLENILELEDKTIAVLKGSVYTDELRHELDEFGIQATLVEKDEFTQVLSAVAQGEVDAGVCTNVLGLQLESQFTTIERTPIIFAPVKIRYAVKKDANPDVLSALNIHLGALKANPQSLYYTDYDRWLNPPPEDFVLPDWVKWSVAGLAVVALALLGVVYTLRLLVARRTAQLLATNRTLRESEEKFATAFRDAPVLIAIASMEEGRFIEVNDKMVEVSGFSRAELIGHTATEVGWLTTEAWAQLLELSHTEGHITGLELKTRKKNGGTAYIHYSGHLITLQGRPHLLSISQDITERRWTDAVTQARLRLMDYALTHSMEDLLQKTLDETGALTDSPIGFYHFVEADQKTLSLQMWSTRTMAEFCRAEGKGLHYPIDQAGVWVECVRERQPVIHNDYANLPHRKGLPPGHAEVKRELVVPIMRGERMVAILGVGNKPTEYTAHDVGIVARLADLAWDVAERKQLDEALARREAELSALFSAMHDVVILYDADGHYLNIAPTSARLLVAEPQALLGRRLTEVLPAPVAQILLNGIHQTLETRELVLVDYELQINGQTVWFAGNFTPVDDHRVLLVAHDNTERVWAEEALRERDEQFRAITAASPDALIVTRLSDGFILYANEQCGQLVGISASELMGRRTPDFYTRPADRRLLLTALEGDGGVTGMELLLKRADGTPFWALVFARRGVFEGEAVMYAGIRDITERKQAEEALRESEQRFRTLIEQSTVSTQIFSPDGRTLQVNPAWEKLWGATLADLENFNVLRDPQLQSAGLMPYIQAGFAGQSTSIPAILYDTPTALGKGTKRWVEGRIYPIVDDEGHVQRVVLMHYDVTERKEAEEALQASEAALRQAQRVAHVGSWVWHIAENRLEWSDEMFRVFGIRREDFSGDLTEVVAQAIHPDDRAAVERANAAVAQEGRPTPLEYRVMWPDGSMHWVWGEAGEIIHDAAGHALRLTGIAQDITERKRAEAAVRDSRDLLESVFSSLNEAVLIIDPVSHITLNCNLAAEILTGCSRAELMGQSMERFYLSAEDFHAFTQETQRALAEKGTMEGERLMRRASGDSLFVEYFIRPLRLATLDHPALLVVIRDVTERVLADDKLRQLSRAVEQSPVTIIITDTTGAIQYANPRFTQTTGYTLAEAIGQNPSLFKSGTTSPQDYKQLWETILAGGEWRGEFLNRRKDGTLYWESASVSPIKDEAGRITHFLAVKEDITERKHAESELAATNIRLEQALWEATQLTISAQSANRLKSEILANTSHELRTPLTGVLGSLSVVLEGLCDSRAEERSFLEAAYSSSQNLLGLINNLLDMAKIESGKMDIETRAVAVGPLLAGVEAQMRAEILEKRLTLRMTDDPPVWVQADPEKLRQILLNLTHNAIKFTDVGEIEITTQADLRAEKAHIYVRDTGVGVPLNQQAKLFQPFVQADGTTTRRFGGTGLGLSISRQLAELMGGQLELYSAGEGQGCTLTLTLPLVPK